MNCSEARDMPLDAVVVCADAKKCRPRDEDLTYVKAALRPGDMLHRVESLDQVNTDSFDLAVIVRACGSTPWARTLAATRIPCMAMAPYYAFHPYQAALYRDLERGGGVVMPANDPEEIAASLQALRARKVLRQARLLVVSVCENEYRQAEIKDFANGCREHLGVEVINRSIAELQELSAEYDDKDADVELQRWYREVLEGPGEMDQVHMRQVAKLYLAERQMIEQNGVCGITVDDIGGFLVVDQPRTMPNVSYGPLVFDGFLVAEEGDIEVLTTELLLHLGLGTHPTMSNIYLSYRDQFDGLSSHELYTSAMELADYRQCLRDNHITATHFSASGVLPANFMEETRYQVREALPAWPGQSMITATPKLGPVVLARLAPDASAVHMIEGIVDSRSLGDHYGWYRSRWFIKIHSVRDFSAKCQHQHYAIGQIRDSDGVLRILVNNALRLSMD